MKVFPQKTLVQDLEIFIPKFCLIENSCEYMSSKASNKESFNSGFMYLK